jgi:hypothetical protein
MIEKKKTKPIYIQSFLIRGIAALLHGILMGVENIDEWTPLLFFQLASFWVIFDLSLNLLRKKSVFHVGESNLIDKYIGAIPEIYWTLKAIAFIAMLVLFVGIQS